MTSSRSRTRRTTSTAAAGRSRRAARREFCRAVLRRVSRRASSDRKPSRRRRRIVSRRATPKKRSKSTKQRGRPRKQRRITITREVRLPVFGPMTLEEFMEANDATNRPLGGAEVTTNNRTIRRVGTRPAEATPQAATVTNECRVVGRVMVQQQQRHGEKRASKWTRILQRILIKKHG